MATKRGAKTRKGLSNPTRRKRFVDAIRLGMTIKLAAQYAGVSRESAHQWLKRGEEQEDGVRRDFYDAVQKADADCAASMLKSVKKAANAGDWRAGRWLMATRHGYKETTRQEVQAEVTLTVDQVVEEAEKLLEDMSDDELERIANSS